MLENDGKGSLVVEEELSIGNKLQPGGRQLMDSIFGEDSDSDSNLNAPISKKVRESANLNSQMAICYNYEILTAQTAVENRNLLQQEIMRKLHENYNRAKKDFQLTIETVLRYIEYNMSFKTFFIIFESAPYSFYNELLQKDHSVKRMRASIIEGSKKYLNNFCSSMFKFLKQLNQYRQRDSLDMDVLEDLFPEVPMIQKSNFLEILNKPAVLNSIFSVTREEELLVKLSSKSFKNFKFLLIDSISDNVIKNVNKSQDWILSDQNIKTIVSNLGDFGVTAKKLSTVKSVLQNFISDENPLPVTHHGYNTRSKEGGTLVSYFGQESSGTGNKGSKKRAVSGEEVSSKSKQIRTSGTVDISRSSSPHEKKEVVKLEDSMFYGEDIKSMEPEKEVESTLADSLIGAQDQQPIEAPRVEDNKSSEKLNLARPGDKMEVVHKECGEWFGFPTVPVNYVDSAKDNFVAEENRENCLLISIAPISPINKVLNDDYSMEVDNGEEFQSTHPPPKRSSNLLMEDFTTIDVDEKRKEIRDSFNEEDTVFLVNTSYSSARSVNDLVASLSNQLREIKAICARFEIDFESLSTGEDNCYSGLDISRVRSKIQDHSDSVAGSGSDVVDNNLVATCISARVPAVQTVQQAVPTTEDALSTSAIVPDDRHKQSQCRISLIQFNEKAIELNLLALVDSFSMEAGLFVRFGGNNAFCSATITVYQHSIRLFLMTLHCKQSARILNQKSIGEYAIPIMEEFNQLISYMGNVNFEEFNRFNVVDVLLSSEMPMYDAMIHISKTVAFGIPRSCIKLNLPTKNTTDTSIPFSILHKSFNEKLEHFNYQDSSIIFIDILQPDTKGNKPANMNFPFIMKRNLSANEDLMYQTSGAIYWCPSASGDLYHVSIVTRSRNQLDSIQYSCYEYDIDRNDLSNVRKSSIVQFPAMKKINYKSYFLKGVIMFLNVLSSWPSRWKFASYNLPKEEVLRVDTTSGVEMSFSNINSLLAYTPKSKSGLSSWLDNSTIYEVLSSFAAFLGDKRNIVMNSDASHGLIQLIINQGNDESVIEDGYERIKDIFKRQYKNMFSSKDSCIHIPVNEPQLLHWNFALVLVEKKSIIVHDPLFKEERVKAIGSAIFRICCLESGEDTSRMKDWNIKTTIQHPQQKDAVNCGVFTMISSIRAMCLIKMNRIHDLYQSWSFPSQPKDLVEYRRRFAKILLDDDKEVELAKFVKMFS